MVKESNPVQQRIEALADKWKEAIEVRKGRIIRLHCNKDELDMVDAFLWYMLGLDSLIDDIAFIIDPFFSGKEAYSRELLAMLEETIREWNETEKKPGIEYIPVDWKPDYSITDSGNPALPFVSNFNELALTLDLEDGRYTVAILPVPHAGMEKEIAAWMESALQAGIAPNVRFLIVDTMENPFYAKLNSRYPEEIVTIVPDFDMSNMMKQVAAMGDPTDPSTPYRISFMNMMEEMKKNNEKKVIREGENCIRIASENAHNNPHWLVQIVVVNIALSNEQLKYKNYRKALQRSDKAVEAAETLPEIMQGGTGMAVVAQARMSRGSVHCFFKKWKEAISDFAVAGEAYNEARNPILALEAYRMAGFCCKRSWENDPLPYLLKGLRLVPRADKLAMQSGTLPILLKQLLEENYKEEITYEEINEIVSPVLGENWPETVKNILKAPDVEAYMETQEA